MTGEVPTSSLQKKNMMRGLGSPPVLPTISFCNSECWTQVSNSHEPHAVSASCGKPRRPLRLEAWQYREQPPASLQSHPGAVTSMNQNRIIGSDLLCDLGPSHSIP